MRSTRRPSSSLEDMPSAPPRSGLAVRASAFALSPALVLGALAPQDASPENAPRGPGRRTEVAGMSALAARTLVGAVKHVEARRIEDPALAAILALAEIRSPRAQFDVGECSGLHPKRELVGVLFELDAVETPLGRLPFTLEIQAPCHFSNILTKAHRQQALVKCRYRTALAS